MPNDTASASTTLTPSVTSSVRLCSASRPRFQLDMMPIGDEREQRQDRQQ